MELDPPARTGSFFCLLPPVPDSELVLQRCGHKTSRKLIVVEVSSRFLFT